MHCRLDLKFFVSVVCFCISKMLNTERSESSFFVVAFLFLLKRFEGRNAGNEISILTDFLLVSFKSRCGELGDISLNPLEVALLLGLERSPAEPSMNACAVLNGGSYFLL